MFLSFINPNCKLSNHCLFDEADLVTISMH